MSIPWLILAILLVTGDAFSLYSMEKLGLGTMGYVVAIPSLLFSIALLYGSIVEGYTLAYIIIAWGVLSAIRGLYALWGRSWIYGGLSVAFGLLFVYWGWQRYGAAQLMYPSMTGSGRRRRRY